MAKKKVKNDASLKFQKIIDSIHDWVVANNNNVSFLASFVTFDQNFEPTNDSLLMAYGPKDICKTHLKVLQEELDKEKDDALVSW